MKTKIIEKRKCEAVKDIIGMLKLDISSSKVKKPGKFQEDFDVDYLFQSIKKDKFLKQYSASKIREELTNCQNKISFFQAAFPDSLRNIPTAPAMIFYQGKIDLLSMPKVAIVGSRYPTISNMKLAAELAEFLAKNNVTVISGLAKGIDAVAHQNSLPKTIAVLGTGFDSIYPRENQELFQKIADDGLVITEYFPKTPPMKMNFPERNRIIASLADIVVIIEAKINSGSMITARFAIEYGKEVFAVPGHPWDYRVRGCNQLIKDGAYLLNDFTDLLLVLERKFDQKHSKGLNESLGRRELSKEFGDDQDSDEERIQDDKNLPKMACNSLSEVASVFHSSKKKDEFPNEKTSRKNNKYETNHSSNETGFFDIKEKLESSEDAKEMSRILNLISDLGTDMEELMKNAGLEVTKTLSILSELELESLVYRDFAGKIYRKFSS